MQYDVTKLFEPDILAEPVFLHVHRMKSVAEPEEALLGAVLSEAIETFRKFAFSKSVRGQILFRQAAEWLWDKEDPDYFFSCKNICEVIGLDPGYLRRGLLQWVEQNRHSARERQAEKLPLARIPRARYRTVYAQRSSVMRHTSPRLKGGWVR